MTAVPPVIAVCGIKNYGKTTLLAGLIRFFTKKGLQIAVIKYDGHDFSCDIPGTDSYRLQQAGAYGTAVYSASRFFIHKKYQNPSWEELVPLFSEADLIFLEGGKNTPLPKIEVIRHDICVSPVSNPTGRFLIATDLAPECFSEPAADLNKPDQVGERILDYLN